MATDQGGASHDTHHAPIHAQDERLEAIYRDHSAALRGRLVALTRDPAIADDVVGEAFYRLAGAIRAGRAPDDPVAWLHRVAANLAVSRARREIVASRAMPRLVDRELADSPEDVVMARDRDRLVHAALATLDEPDRQLVVMAAQGYRPIEIAGMTGRSNEATRTRLCRARRRLRAQLLMSGVV
jgi:RNA polymerase sigma-70 factor (ECF subfamily)